MSNNGKTILGRAYLNPSAQTKQDTPTRLVVWNESNDQLMWADTGAIIDDSNYLKLTGETEQSIEGLVNFVNATIASTPVNANDIVTKAYADGLVVGLFRLANTFEFDASGGTYPLAGTGTGTGGAIRKGDSYVVTVAGTINGQDYGVGDTFYSKTNNPGQTPANWGRFEVPAGIATNLVAGIMFLYSSTGSATNGTMTQAAITTALNGKINNGSLKTVGGISVEGGPGNIPFPTPPSQVQNSLTPDSATLAPSVTSANAGYVHKTGSIAEMIDGLKTYADSVYFYGKIGMNTSTPSALLQVNGTGAIDRVFYFNNYNSTNALGGLIEIGRGVSDYCLDLRDSDGNRIALFRGDRQILLGVDGTTPDSAIRLSQLTAAIASANNANTIDTVLGRGNTANGKILQLNALGDATNYTIITSGSFSIVSSTLGTTLLQPNLLRNIGDRPITIQNTKTAGATNDILQYQGQVSGTIFGGIKYDGRAWGENPATEPKDYVRLNESGYKASATKTTSYTVVSSDYGGNGEAVFPGDATTNAFTITLDTPANMAGKTVTVVKIDSSANAVTIKGNGTTKINGANTYLLTGQYQNVTIKALAGQYYIC